MKINRSRYALLGILKHQECSGYDIKKVIDRSISNFWFEEYGRIYPELKQMERGGLVTKVEEINENGLNRKIYKITKEGESEFERWLLLRVEKQQTRNELLLKIFFGKKELVDNVIQKIQQEKYENEMLLKKYGQIEAILTDAGNPENESMSPFWSITLSYGKHKAEAVLKWCDESINVLKTLNENKKK